MVLELKRRANHVAPAVESCSVRYEACYATHTLGLYPKRSHIQYGIAIIPLQHCQQRHMQLFLLFCQVKRYNQYTNLTPLMLGYNGETVKIVALFVGLR